jgi:hypothetical protein
MIEYKNRVFTSKSKSFNFDEVDEKIVFEWVKTGVLSYTNFSKYLGDVRDESRTSGYEDGYEYGICIGQSGGY